MSTVAERVAAGAAFLDGREPGWWERIDLGSLDMTADCGCVLGQLNTDLGNPGWGEIARRFGVRRASSTFADDARPCDWELGFNASMARGRDAQDREFGELEAEWKRVITERRDGAL